VSPGPKQRGALGFGLRFGFRRTIPHVLGTAVGVALRALTAAASVGTLLEAAPAIEVV
jgi:threonine/homoserine/homoserine lactone efflux protein